MATAETSEKKAIKEYLALKGWFYYHNLAAMGVYPGIPDITAIKNGQVLQIEVKKSGWKESNSKTRDNQRQFERDWTECGGAYFCGTLDQLINFLK
jgi:Holliday junction resolvase